MVLIACAAGVAVSAAPLWAMARWNNPRADGIAINVLTLPAPPD